MVKYLVIFFLQFNFLTAQLEANLIASGFDQPLYVKNYPRNSNILLIVEQDGIIKIVKNKQTQEQPFMDISDRVHQTWYPADERGLLGLAFDPNFDFNNNFYLNYVNQDGYTVISRFNSKDDLGDSNSEEILLKLKQPYMNHNGGFLEFGPDGYLYISIGDGGSAGDPEKRAQDLSNLFGTIIRIDVSKEFGYTIPKDNPFYNKDNIKNEIWHYGLRNVWRFSFDKKNGDLYMGDVGQNQWEEIDYHQNNKPGGLNYGWNIFEGNHCYDDDNINCNSEGTTLPIFEYPNDANYAKTIIGWNQQNMHGCSVTGGYVYRGKNIPDLYGRYIFGDYCTGKVWSFIKGQEDTSLIDHTEELLNSMNKSEFYLSSFGEGEDGELYLIDYSGDVYSITK